MDHTFLPFFMFVSQLFAPKHSARIQFLLVQIRILRERVDASRIVPTPEEKADLLRWGAEFDHNIEGVIEIVKPGTYRRWLRLKKMKFPFKRSGRPRIAASIRGLVRRMAVENVSWGYSRIVGELKKLGCCVSRMSIKRILEEEGIYPLPAKARKRPTVKWTTFVHAHMETLIACDFFTKPVYTLGGKVNAHVLVFIHLGSRKVFCSAPTFSPDGDWVMQQARNASIWLSEIGVKPRYLIHDRDRKYPDRFTSFWLAEGVRCLRTPRRGPQANAFCECFIGKFKHECLNHFVCFSRGQLQHIVTVWLRYYNTRRPHQGLGINNEVLDEAFQPQTVGVVRCKEELGGIVKSYYREAA